MAHTFTTYLSQGHFNAALLADHTAVFETLVLTAQTFIVFYRTKDLGAEQTITFRLEGTIVNGFGFLDFTE